MRTRLCARLIVSALISALAGACATLPQPSSTQAPVVADAPFTADGRLSARRDQDAITVSFRWKHAPPRDDVELSTPLGQTVAEFSGDAAAGVARVVLADGRKLEAGDFDALSMRALGFPLPVAGLAAWIRGGPHARSPHQAELDAAGRVALLRQDGWEIVHDYADSNATHPERLRLIYADVEVRVVIDHLD